MRTLRHTYTPPTSDRSTRLALVVLGACCVFLMLYFDAIGIALLLDSIHKHTHC